MTPRYYPLQDNWHRVDCTIAGERCTFFARSREEALDNAFIHHRRAFGTPKEHVALWNLAAKAHDLARFREIAAEEQAMALAFTDSRRA